MTDRKEERKDTKEDVKDNGQLAEELADRLQEEFYKVIDDPTEKKIKKYQEIEEALLAYWLKETLSNLLADINKNIALGKSNAVQQLRKKGFKKVVDNEEIYSELAKSQKSLVRADLEKVIAGIKANSRKNIAEMRKAFILQKKRLTAGFMETFRKYGVAYFTDRAGRKWTLKRYIDMATTTTLANANREAFFAKSVEWGNDLVKVFHLNISPECPLCAPFTGKVLSISGKTRGYMSVEEASHSGHLFSYNCDHYADALQLAPEKEEGDNQIELTDKNIKQLEKSGYSNIKNKPFYKAVDKSK